MGATAWLFAFLAVADFLDLCQVPAEVVAETASEVVDTLFFDQAVGVVVGKGVGGVVFVGQCCETDGLVVLIGNGFAFGVFASGGQATRVAGQPGDLAFAIGMRKYLTEGVVGEIFCG
ncbi:hypothetical protein ALO38_200076 [Pseudomonas coronafaciens pv. zizaniae]|nr:hypothetical protein ALO38_200076 [Pseudomonas coronafaciens pv. zizaniae]